MQEKLLTVLMETSGNDLLLRNVSSHLQGTTYLTDTSVEAEFFSAAFVQDDEKLWRADTLARLTHSIPIFQELSLEDLVRLRLDEHLAFANYRNSVRKAVEEASPSSSPDVAAEKIWQDVIRPEVETLRAKAAAIKSTSRKALATRAIAAGATISLGAFGSHLPAEISHAIEAICACTLLKDFLPPLAKGQGDLQSESYYFLLEADNEASKKRTR